MLPVSEQVRQNEGELIIMESNVTTCFPIQEQHYLLEQLSDGVSNQSIMQIIIIALLVIICVHMAARWIHAAINWMNILAQRLLVWWRLRGAQQEPWRIPDRLQYRAPVQAT